MTAILSGITNLIIHIISTLGYAGVGFLMALQTVAIPIPSEIILPFSGFLASQGKFNIFIIAIVGALGSCIGSSIAYYIGFKGGRPLVEKFGKYILISRHDLDLTEKFFFRFETPAIFFGQLLPVIRSFIAFAAGIAKAEYKKFVIYTFVGSFIWSLGLAYVGEKLGENWGSLKDRFHNFDNAIVILIVLGIIWWVWRHLKLRAKDKAN
jgi:membrane protein DedA with SNARE-associated domain